MLIDLLSMDNYVHYNIKIAQILGLHAAIYISELLNINEKAVRKDKVSDNCFIVDRNYIERRTTLSKDEQKEIDAVLLNLGILKTAEGNDDGLTLDLTILTSLVSAEPISLEKLEKVITAAKNSKPKRTKSDAIRDNLKEKIVATNAELRAAYEEWIDAVYAKQGWMSAKSVTVAQTTIDNYCNHNLDLALHIIEIASINGYRDIQWAINSYEKDYKVSYSIPVAPAKAPAKVSSLSSEVF